MEKTLYGELQIMPLTKRHELTFFNSGSTELNDFLNLEVLAVFVTDGINGYRYRRYPAIKIARLAVDKKFERKGVGRFILLTSIGKVVSVSNEIGCRYITVDSKPESIGFYEKHGFKVVEKYRHTDFPKMYLNIYPIASMMQPKESLQTFEDKEI